MPRKRVPVPAYAPQLALSVDAPPPGARWLHELKYDGYRIGCSVGAGAVRLTSRNGNDWTAAFPEVVVAVKKLRIESALFDGEVAVVLPDGRTSFQALQNAFGKGDKRATLRGITYFVFDLLHLDGEDLAPLPLEERRRRLSAVLGSVGLPLRVSDAFDVEGAEVFRRACDMGFEGIVSKLRDAPYRPGRSDVWRKAKCLARQELVVGGYTEPSGSRSGFGALLVGFYEGDALRFAGKVGTGKGFTDAFLRSFRSTLDGLAQPTCPFEPPPDRALARRAHWVRPELVIEVAFTEWTAAGIIRQPSFQGLRADKAAKDVVRERPITASAPTHETPAPSRRRAAGPRTGPSARRSR